MKFRLLAASAMTLGMLAGTQALAASGDADASDGGSATSAATSDSYNSTSTDQSNNSSNTATDNSNNSMNASWTDNSDSSDRSTYSDNTNNSDNSTQTDNTNSSDNSDNSDRSTMTDNSDQSDRSTNTDNSDNSRRMADNSTWTDTSTNGSFNNMSMTLSLQDLDATVSNVSFNANGAEDAGSGSGTINTGDIAQDGSYANFAGIQTASFNTGLGSANQAATSIAANANISFGSAD